ncbi:DUF4440 domain-containing protein [Kordia sp. YSTF-M3]|uniref:DUF4440 domain-containing protein n=1 Tax=Kordia aestuariivivens TaxID=2759037 RepID=A0ABR7Q7V3_9FLAO|nr:DUF4440 domain-containing protein [Kordia aestuariivivens]MBC8754625.1 DUF4440 domain-containing protein [Kordia aestuariivivens]
MKSIKNYFASMLFLGMLIFSNSVFCQESEMGSPDSLEDKILALDAKFWKAYNSCAVDDFKQFLTDDLEFYHDKGGLTKTSDKLISLVKTGLCKDPNVRLRREAVFGTIHVYPLQNYGAIITGKHLFYVTENGGNEQLVESAKFTHVWQNKNGVWRMSRVLSYDHQQASKNSNTLSIQLSMSSMKSLIGTYKAPNTGMVTISMKDNTLRIKAGQLNSELFAQSETSLFIKEAPLRFKFEKNSDGKVVKFTVYENGNAVEEAVRVE